MIATITTPIFIQPELETERLLLAPRTLADLDSVARLNEDPAVMRFIAPVGDPMMTREGLAARSFTHVAEGLGYWSVFARGDYAAASERELLGYVGLRRLADEDGQVELSYRFAARHWGRGYAAEAAGRLLRHSFEALSLADIAVLTHPQNDASLRLADRLGFIREADRPSWMMGRPDFPCAFLRLTRTRWLSRRAA